MRHNKLQFVLYILISLAIIGVVSSLIQNPGSFLVQIFMIVAIAFVVFLIFSYVVQRRSPHTSSEMKKYRQAVKQSKEKYKQKQPRQRSNNNQSISANLKKSPNQRKKRRIKRHSHLRVIEGKKKES